MLYLTYMTTSAASHPHKIYPKAQVTIVPPKKKEASSSGVITGVIVDPYHDDNSEERHVTRTTAIGLLPAGTSVQIKIQPLEETLAPFRVVGASILAKEKVSLKISAEYDLEPERLHMGRLYRELHVW